MSNYTMTIKYAIKLVERRAEYLSKRIADRESKGLVCHHEKAERQAIHKLIAHIYSLEASYQPPSKRATDEPSEETLQKYRDLAAGKRPDDQDDIQPCPS